MTDLLAFVARHGRLFCAGLLLVGGLQAAGAQDHPVEIVPSLSKGTIRPITLTADGRYTALTTDNGAEVWDLDAGRLLRRFTGTRELAQHSNISPDGRYVVALSNPDLFVWDTASGKRLLSLTPPSGMDFQQAAFDPQSGTIFVLASEAVRRSIVTAYEVPSGRHVWTLTEGRANEDITVSADGRLIALAGWQGTATILSTDGKRLRTVKATNGISVWAVALSPDGQHLVTGAYEEPETKIWNIATGKLLRRLTTASGCSELAWSPDGRLITCNAAGSKLTWDWQSGAVVAQTKPMDVEDADLLTDDRILIEAFAYLPNGTLLTWARFGQKGASALRVLDPLSFRQIREIGTDGDFGNFRTVRGADEQVFLLGHQPSIVNVATGTSETLSQKWSDKAIKALTGTWFVDWSPDLGVFAALNRREGSVTVVRPASDAIETLHHGPGTAQSVRVSPGGDKLVIGFEDAVEIVDLARDNAIRRLTTKDVYWYEAVFSDSGRFVANSTYSKSAIINMETNKVQIVSRDSAPTPIGLTNGDEDVVAINTSGETLSVLSSRTLKQKRLFRVPDTIYSAYTLHPDGRHVALASHDSQMRLWNIENGALVQTYDVGAISQRLAFAAQGRRLLASGAEGIKIFDTDSGTLLASTMIGPDGEWVTITPEGFFDASPGGGKYLSIVRGMEILSIDQLYQVLYRPDLVREKLAGDPQKLVATAAAKLDLNSAMASGAPPRVAITSPATGASAPTDEVEIEVTLADQGGGIGRVEWRVNGVTLGLQSRGLERIDTPAAGAAPRRIETMKRTLGLEPGENRIEVVAYNGRGIVASEPAQITVAWDGAQTAAPPRLFVLAAGVNDYYDSRLRLAYAVPDAVALGEGFRKAGQGLYSSIEVRTVLDSEVTADGLDKVFAEFAGKVEPRDVFVFFLAGHGKTRDGRYYFLPRDFRWQDETSIETAGIGQDRFQAWFAGIKARKSLLLYDTCESGSLTGSAARGVDIDARLGALNRMARATGRTFITATTDNAPALEGYRGHGVFTYALLEALGSGDLNGNGLIEVSELAEHVDRRVPDLSFEAFKLRQIPQYSGRGNNFALIGKAEILVAGATPAAALTGAPTHVVIAPAPVRPLEGAAATPAGLAVGTQVILVETRDGWALVAREGRQLGYIEAAALARLQ